MLSSFGVIRAVRAPDRAAPAHASAPACPPPMTTTSYGFSLGIEETVARPLVESILVGLVRRPRLNAHNWCERSL